MKKKKKKRKNKIEKYKCIKTVEAEPQKLTEELFNRVKGSGAKVGDDGYKVRYEDGYESWSPKEVFEKGYIPLIEEVAEK